MGESTRRTWNGTTADARRTARRVRLLDAGLELLSSRGREGVTVRLVCRSSRLTERYFYESFDGKDQFLIAVYEQTTAVFRDAILKALSSAPGDQRGRVRAIYGAMVDAAADDPRHGRVVTVVALSDPALSRLGRESVERVGRLIAGPPTGAAGPDAIDAQLTGIALAGSTWNLIISWLDGRLDISRDRLIDHLVDLTMNALPTTSRARP